MGLGQIYVVCNCFLCKDRSCSGSSVRNSSTWWWWSMVHLLKLTVLHSHTRKGLNIPNKSVRSRTSANVFKLEVISLLFHVNNFKFFLSMIKRLCRRQISWKHFFGISPNNFLLFRDVGGIWKKRMSAIHGSKSQLCWYENYSNFQISRVGGI